MSANPPAPALFRPEAIPPEVRAFNEAFLARATAPPAGVDGPDPLMPRPESPHAFTRPIPAPGGCTIEVRIIAPALASPRGAYLHLHAGGPVFGSTNQDDAMLERIAGAAQLPGECRAPACPCPSLSGCLGRLRGRGAEAVKGCGV